MIDLLKLSVCVLFLLYSCRSDLRTRTVPNELWGVVFVAALPLVIADVLVRGSEYLLHTIIAVMGIYMVVYVLFRLKVFGGADAKAIIALSFIIPAFPGIMIFGYGLPLMGVPPLNIFAFSALMNAVILTPLVLLGILAAERLMGRKVCVTSGIPFMLPITAGFISAIIFGDMILLGVVLL